jgi:hypothetical protein
MLKQGSTRQQSCPGDGELPRAHEQGRQAVRSLAQTRWPVRFGVACQQDYDAPAVRNESRSCMRGSNQNAPAVTYGTAAVCGGG